MFIIVLKYNCHKPHILLLSAFYCMGGTIIHKRIESGSEGLKMASMAVYWIESSISINVIR